MQKIWDTITAYLLNDTIDSTIIIACFVLLFSIAILWLYKNYEFSDDISIIPLKLSLKKKKKVIEVTDLNRKIEKMQGELGLLLELTDNILRHHVNNQMFQRLGVDFGLNTWSNIVLKGEFPKEKEFPYLLYIIIDKNIDNGKKIRAGENIYLLLRTSCKVKDIVIIAKSICGDVRLRVSPIAEYFFYTKIELPNDTIEGGHKISFNMEDYLTGNVWEKQYINIEIESV